jgi:peptide/nickel transport system permease protein
VLGAAARMRRARAVAVAIRNVLHCAMLRRVSGNLARRGAVVGGIFVAVVVGIAVLAPWIAGDPNAIDVQHGLSAAGAPLGPNEHGLLGTDALGRDVWARVVAGASASMLVATIATLASLAIGLAIGVGAAMASPRIDGAIMRGVDLVLAFPALLLAILLAALLRETSLAESNAPVVFALVAVSWTATARVVRTRAHALVRSDTVMAIRALGATPWRIATRHVLPGCAGVAITLAAVGFAQLLLAEAALAFVGLGAPAPAASWGRMLYEGRAYYRTAPWMIAAPGVALLVAVIGFNLLAEAARARVDRR